MGDNQAVEYNDFEEEKVQPKRGRSIDYEQKKRRAERILEQARLRDLLGYDVDYED